MNMLYPMLQRWTSSSLFVIKRLVKFALIGQANPSQPIGGFLIHPRSMGHSKKRSMFS